MMQITALLAEAEKDQLILHKQSAAHLRDCERRAKEYMESLSPTVLIKTAPTFFHANQQRQMSANPNIASPTPRTPTGQLKLTGNNPKWDRQNPHLLNGKLYSSHVPCEQYRHYKCDHCDLYEHLRYDCPAYKCPVCQTSCGKKPKTCPKIIPPLVMQMHMVDVPPPYCLPSMRQDGRQMPFHSETLNNPVPIADHVCRRVPLRNRSRGRGMPSHPYQRIAPRPLAPIINDMCQTRHADIPRIHIDHRRQPFRADIPYPHHHRELVPVLDPYEIPTSRTPNQVVDYVNFPAANMSVTYNPRPTVVGFRSRDTFIDACIDAGDYGELFEW